MRTGPNGVSSSTNRAGGSARGTVGPASPVQVPGPVSSAVSSEGGTGFEVTPDALQLASLDVLRAIDAVQTTVPLASQGAAHIIEDMVKAAGRPAPALALRRFLDHAHQSVRVGLTDTHMLADQLDLSAIAYSNTEDAQTQRFRTPTYGSASPPGTGAASQSHAPTAPPSAHKSPEPPETTSPTAPSNTAPPAAPHSVATHEPGHILQALNPGMTNEQIERLLRSERGK
jgi:hypothetical protein